MSLGIGYTTVRKGSAIRFVITHFLLSRAIIFLSAYLAVALTQPVRNEPVPLFNVTVAKSALTRMSYGGDSGWYESVVRNGYDKPNEQKQVAQRNWAFFPLYPLALAAIETTIVLGAILWVAMAGAATLLYAITERHHGTEVARWATLFFLYWPWSYSVSALRPEAMLGFLWLGSYVAFCKGRYGWSAAAAFLSALAKPNGFLIAILLGMQSWTRRQEPAPDKQTRYVWPLAAIAAGPAALALFSAYMWSVTGDPLSWATIQKTWGAQLGVQPARQLAELFTEPLLIGRWGWDATAFSWLAFGAVLAVARPLWRADQPLAVFLLTVSLLSFLNFGVWVHGRHVAVLFPFFIGLALLLKHDRQRVAALVVSASLLTLFVTLAVIGVNAFLA